MSTEYRLARTIIGKPVISVSQGQRLNKVEDLYIDADANRVEALYLGTEGGLFNRKRHHIAFTHVDVVGVDVVLVSANDVVERDDETPAAANWRRLDKLVGRRVDTTGGTPIGKVSDAVLDGVGNIIGFRLSDISVAGPVADNKAVSREAIVDLGEEDGAMTIDMRRAEEQALTINP